MHALQCLRNSCVEVVRPLLAPADPHEPDLPEDPLVLTCLRQSHFQVPRQVGHRPLAEPQQHQDVAPPLCEQPYGTALTQPAVTNVMPRNILTPLDARAETTDVWRQRFWCVEVRPVVLFEQFERELELVEERHAVDCIGDRRLVLHDIVHVPQSSPGSIRR